MLALPSWPRNGGEREGRRACSTFRHQNGSECWRQKFLLFSSSSFALVAVASAVVVVGNGGCRWPSSSSSSSFTLAAAEAVDVGGGVCATTVPFYEGSRRLLRTPMYLVAEWRWHESKNYFVATPRKVAQLTIECQISPQLLCLMSVY